MPLRILPMKPSIFSPIGLVGPLERGAKHLDGLDLRFRAGEIAAARHSETATAMCGRDGRMLAARVEQKNEATKHDKNGVMHP